MCSLRLHQERLPLELVRTVCVCESLFCLAVSSLQDVLQDCIQACLLPASSEAFNATADQSSLPDTIYLD